MLANSKTHCRQRLLQKACGVVCEALERRQLLTSIIANFTDGNGTASVDRYVGTSGSGWNSAWAANPSNSGSFNPAPTVVTSGGTPLNGGGYYLAATWKNASGKTNGT